MSSFETTPEPDSSSERQEDLFLDFRDDPNDDDNVVVDPDDPNGTWERIRGQQTFMKPLEQQPQQQQWALQDDDNKNKNNNNNNNATDHRCTRFVLMSDTHGKHRALRPPPGDVLIHAGDLTKLGEPGTLADLRDYFVRDQLEQRRFDQVICIAGNHDITLHTEFYRAYWSRFAKRGTTVPPWDEAELQTYLTQDESNNLVYLQDSSCQIATTTMGHDDDDDNDDDDADNHTLQVYGSPWSPFFGCWAFGEERGHRIRQLWRAIPDTTDILITHGPPLGRGDETFHSGCVGCYDLLQEVQDRIQPRLHVFGHIHEQGGSITFDGTTLFCNASSVNLQYRPAHYCCTVVDVPHAPDEPARVVKPHCPIRAPHQWPTWLQENGFDKLVPYVAKKLEEDDSDDGDGRTTTTIPVGNNVFREDTYEELCGAWGLERDAEARQELSTALAELYRQSFPPRQQQRQKTTKTTKGEEDGNE